MDEQIIQAVTGGADAPTDTAEAIGKAARRLDEIAGQMAEAKASDTARFDALSKEQAAQAEILTGLKAKFDEEAREATLQTAAANAKAALEMASGLRAPSKAGLIGSNGVLVPSLGGYKAGAFLQAIDTLNRTGAFDGERQAAKATLESLGSFYMTPEEAGSKATLGLTDATGGWIVPNAVVEPIIKTGRYRPGVTRLVTRRTGLADQYQVDIPFQIGRAHV